MATMKQRAAARRNIKKAQAALRAKGRAHRKAKPKKASRSRSRGRAVARGRQSRAMFPEAGKWARGYRVLDILTTGIQQGIRVFGFTRDALVQAKHTILGIGPDGRFNLQTAIPHAEAVGLGFIRDKIRSKLGVYRGMAKGKIASYGIALSPEIVAIGHADPMTDPWAWKTSAVRADRAYDLEGSGFDMGFPEFKESIVLDAALYVSQKIAEKTGINRELSKLTDGLVKV